MCLGGMAWYVGRRCVGLVFGHDGDHEQEMMTKGMDISTDRPLVLDVEI